MQQFREAYAVEAIETICVDTGRQLWLYLTNSILIWKFHDNPETILIFFCLHTQYHPSTDKFHNRSSWTRVQRDHAKIMLLYFPFIETDPISHNRTRRKDCTYITRWLERAPRGEDGVFVYGAAYCFIQETEYWNESQYIGRVRFQPDASISTRYIRTFVRTLVSKRAWMDRWMDGWMDRER